MTFRRSVSGALLAPVLLFSSQPLLAQASALSPEALRDWSAANRVWLRRQVTPNRAVPDPDPTRRRLLISYDVSAQKSPRVYSRSATYDDALAALVFLITGERDRAAFTLHALARLARAEGSLWTSYNTANNWPDEDDHASALLRAGAVA
jgi:hypothetical protein